MTICHVVGSDAVWVDRGIDARLQAEIRDLLKRDRAMEIDYPLQGQRIPCHEIPQTVPGTIETEPSRVWDAILKFINNYLLSVCYMSGILLGAGINTCTLGWS